MNRNKHNRVAVGVSFADHRRGIDVLWQAALGLAYFIPNIIGRALQVGALRVFPSLVPAEAKLKLLWENQTPVKSVGDPYLGFVFPPHYQTEIVSHDFRFTVESDEHGFRNASPWPDRAEVVVVGDSMAYGWGVNERERWTTLLDDALPASRVITLGMPGTTPQQYSRYFEKFGVALRPRIVLHAGHGRP